LKKHHYQTSVPHHKAVPRRLKLIEKPVDQLFKMSKFKKINAVVDCHRESKFAVQNPSQETADTIISKAKVAFAV
jgi:hypothetical protein